MAPDRVVDRLAVALDGAGEREALEHVDHVVGDEAAFVPALVEHQGLLVELRVEVAVEVGVAGAAGVGHIDVGHLAAGEFVDLAPVWLDPVEIAQAVLVVDGNHGDVAGSLSAVGVGADVEHGLLAGGAVEECVEVVGGVQFAAVDGEQVFALLDVDAGQGERRGQAGGPVLPAEDFGDAVAAVFDLVVGAQQAGLGLRCRGGAARRRTCGRW